MAQGNIKFNNIKMSLTCSRFVIDDPNIDEDLRKDLEKLNFMLGMMAEFGNNLADNLLKCDNKGMNYAEAMVYDHCRVILP